MFFKNLLVIVQSESEVVLGLKSVKAEQILLHHWNDISVV